MHKVFVDKNVPIVPLTVIYLALKYLELAWHDFDITELLHRSCNWPITSYRPSRAHGRSQWVGALPGASWVICSAWVAARHPCSWILMGGIIILSIILSQWTLEIINYTILEHWSHWRLSLQSSSRRWKLNEINSCLSNQYDAMDRPRLLVAQGSLTQLG